MSNTESVEGSLERIARTFDEILDELRDINAKTDDRKHSAAFEKIGKHHIFVPDIATEDDLVRAVKAAINAIDAHSLSDMGRVIKATRGNLKGKSFDEKDVRELVRRLLEN